MGLLTDRINNKFKKSNSINGHALNGEPVPLILSPYLEATFVGAGGASLNFKCGCFKL